MLIKVIKNIIISVLAILAILLWLNNDPDEVSSDLDDVTIEYKCSVLKEYRHVPPEVVEECQNRYKSNKDVDSKSEV